MLRVHIYPPKVSYPLAAFAALKAMVSENTPSRTQALLEVHLLAQCPVTGRHTPTFSRQRGTLLCAAARFGRSSVCVLGPRHRRSLGARLIPLGYPWAQRKGTGET